LLRNGPGLNAQRAREATGFFSVASMQAYIPLELRAARSCIFPLCKSKSL